MLSQEMNVSRQSGTIRTLPWTEAFASLLETEAELIHPFRDDEIYVHSSWTIRLERISNLEQVDFLNFKKAPVLEEGDAIVFPVYRGGRVGRGWVVRAEGKWSPLRGSLFFGNDRVYGHFHA